MVAFITRGLLLGLAVTAARAELQLVPVISEYELDGMKFKQLAFSDADKRATYQPPRCWDYSGSANQLTLHPPGKTQAEATISKTGLGEPGSFDGEALKKVVAETMTQTPKGSSGVMVVSQEKNPLLINGKETFQVVLSYSLLGQTFNRSVLFLNRGHEQLRFQLVAREVDFKELHRAFQASLYSWQNL